MRRKWLCLFALFIFFISTSQIKAEPFALSIDDAIERALEQSISLLRSEIDLALSEYAASNLWSEIIPGFSLNAGMTILPSTPLFTDPGFTYNSDALSYNFTFGVSFTINPSVRASMERIELAYRTQLLNYEAAKTQLEIQVVREYLRLITRWDYLTILEENLEQSRERMELDRIARENGLLSELAWLNSQLSVETARYNLSDARSSYRNALEEFLFILGIDAGTEIIFFDDTDIVPRSFNAEQLILEHLPRRPDIIRHQQNIHRLELGESITTQNSRLPTLSFSTQWRGFSSPSSPMQRQGLRDPFADSLSATISLSIPLDSWIPGTRQNQNIRSAAAEVEKARLDLENAESAAGTRIRSLVSNLNNLNASLEIAQLRVDIALRTVEATEDAFRNGTVSYRELEDRRRDLTDARQRLLDGEFQYRSLLLDLAAELNIDWRVLIRPI